MKLLEPLNLDICRKACLSRDARFDGKFFVAVKTTGVYCRPICPANPPREINVIYFATAIQASNNGYRPCLRCRPDSAPQSSAWIGSRSTLNRAVRLIENGALQQGALSRLSGDLGISDRYLRRIFKQHLGTSPKSLALFQQCLFAKQLLHQTTLPVTDIALASGFNSIRRFNDCFKKLIRLTPTQVRRSDPSDQHSIELKLYYRPPYDWHHLLSFISGRSIDGLEKVESQKYSRTIQYGKTRGQFSIEPAETRNFLKLKLSLDSCINMNLIVSRIRRMFDLDADISIIDKQLKPLFEKFGNYRNGLRIPGTWNCFEAGIRAILGQQVSLAAARQLVTRLVIKLGAPLHGVRDKILFPTPREIARSDLQFLKMPDSRRQTLKRLAEWYLQADYPEDVEQWLQIKGIGRWTLDYVKIRAKNDPDIWLGTDLGVKKALSKTGLSFDIESATPWRSYLTFHCWDQL